MDEGRTWVEEIEVAGSELKERVKELIEEGNVRRLIIRSSDDKVLIQLSLTQGAVVGSLVTLFTPPLAVLIAAVALLSKVKVQVVRVADAEEA
jgi:hypothetical protein